MVKLSIFLFILPVTIILLESKCFLKKQVTKNHAKYTEKQSIKPFLGLSLCQNYEES